MAEKKKDITAVAQSLTAYLRQLQMHQHVVVTYSKDRTKLVVVAPQAMADKVNKVIPGPPAIGKYNDYLIERIYLQKVVVTKPPKVVLPKEQPVGWDVT